MKNIYWKQVLKTYLKKKKKKGNQIVVLDYEKYG